VTVPVFVASLDPPDDVARRWFVVGDGNVGLVDDADAFDLADGEPHFLGVLDGIACFAVDGTAIGTDRPLESLHSLYGRVDDVEWTVAGRAVQLVEWARTHRYCGRCGTPTEPARGERAMRCPACGLLAFPRLAPAVIVVVERDGGREALLARGRQFPIPMYSALAGFVEPGETLEEAVHREVREEVGIEIADVAYVASQPWPFPHSLMVGFTATWASGDIAVDERELVDAAWFTPGDLPMIPPAMSIARRLIDAWARRATAAR
jgi:NAD+ diphosphatase